MPPKIRLVLAGLFVASLTALTSTASAHIQTAYLKDGEVWVKRTGAQVSVQLTRDGKPKSSVRISPNGKRIAFFIAGDAENKLRSVIVVLDENGRKLAEYLPSGSVAIIDPETGRQEFELPAFSSRRCNSLCNSLNSVEWVDNQRLGADCHSNPSMSAYLVLEPLTGEIVHSYVGYNFIWSPDKKILAHVGWMKHFTDCPQSEYLQLNDKTVYPKTSLEYGNTNAKIHTFLPPFVWSPDSQTLAALDALSGKANAIELVLITRDGRATVKQLPLKSKTDCQGLFLRWEGPNRLGIHGTNCHLSVDTRGVQ